MLTRKMVTMMEGVFLFELRLPRYSLMIGHEVFSPRCAGGFPYSRVQGRFT